MIENNQLDWVTLSHAIDSYPKNNDNNNNILKERGKKKLKSRLIIIELFGRLVIMVGVGVYVKPKMERK